VKDSATPLFAGDVPPVPNASAPAAGGTAAGHFDELKGEGAQTWQNFFETLGADDQGDLNQRSASLARQIRDNGVTYNVYADEGGPQRPWSLDLFPLIISPESWLHIETGVKQRMKVLHSVMTDVYGPQRLLAKGLLPSALVHGHPGYLRAMHGVDPVGGTHLHVAAFDLARGPDGNWWVVSQRTQAPSGLGYLLENRLAVSRLFPKAFESMHVQRLAGTYRTLVESLKSMSPAGNDAHIALLTPGPYNETYFEHAYLARYLGLTLVEGGDLTVRDQHLYLKTLKGLVPVHGLLKRVDDRFLDPLELWADSTLGVPGLLQAIRMGNVLVANAPGTAFLESPALLGFLPALSRHLLGEDLSLPALPTWWCGERSAMESALPQLREYAIKPTYPGSVVHGDFDAVLARTLSTREVDEWAGRIVRQSDEFTLQTYLPASQIPTWTAAESGGHVAMRSVILRVFAVSDGPQSWRVLPGGLARVAGATADMASMQRGGSSADVWVMTHDAIDTTTLLKPTTTPGAIAHRKRLVTSRAAENLYWLGRYTERAENLIRLARITLEWLHGEEQNSEPLLEWLSTMAITNTLVLPGVPSAAQARRVFERSLIASLGSTELATSVGYNLRALRMAASSVRERLSQEHWSIINQVEEQFSEQAAPLTRTGEYSAMDALKLLKTASDHMAAITGAQTDRMTRDDGWRLLSSGRHIERLGFLANSLATGFETRSVLSEGGFEAMIALFDSTITFHAQYQQSRDVAALLDLLVLDRDNPRSLGWVAQTLRGRLSKLADSPPDQMSALSQAVPDPQVWELALLCEADSDNHYPALMELLGQCRQAAFTLSDEIGALYFTHSALPKHSVGA